MNKIKLHGRKYAVQKGRRVYMLAFLGGTVFGSMLGVAWMCMFQINRKNGRKED